MCGVCSAGMDYQEYVKSRLLHRAYGVEVALVCCEWFVVISGFPAQVSNGLLRSSVSHCLSLMFRALLPFGLLLAGHRLRRLLNVRVSWPAAPYSAPFPTSNIR